MLSDQNLAQSFTFFISCFELVACVVGQCCMRHVSSCVLHVCASDKVWGISWVAEKTGGGGGGGGERRTGFGPKGGRRRRRTKKPPTAHLFAYATETFFREKIIIQWYSFYKNISLSFLCVQISNLVAWLFKYFSQLWRLCCYRICMS